MDVMSPWGETSHATKHEKEGDSHQIVLQAQIISTTLTNEDTEREDELKLSS